MLKFNQRPAEGFLSPSPVNPGNNRVPPASVLQNHVNLNFRCDCELPCHAVDGDNENVTPFGACVLQPDILYMKGHVDYIVRFLHTIPSLVCIATTLLWST